MKLWNSFLTAFGMYSRLPVPSPQWKAEYMPYVMCFFPLVGAVIGAVMYGVFWIAGVLSLPVGFTAALYTIVPVCISGGIHMDGYLDTLDALASHAKRERKLEILKDSHTGAFAVIGAGIYFVLSYGAWTGVQTKSSLICICITYVLSRSLSGLSVVAFPKAKKEGSFAALFSDAAKKRTVKLVLACYFVLSGAVWVMAAGAFSGVLLCLTALVYMYYYWMSKREFGGITGDLAGYFLQSLELVILCTVVFMR